MTNDLSMLSDNFGYLTKGVLLGFDKAITDTYIPSSTYGMFRYEKDGGGGSADTLAFLSGQTSSTPAAATAGSAFWSMLNESDGSTGSNLLFEPIVDYDTTDTTKNRAWIGFHNHLFGIQAYYQNAGVGTASYPSHTFIGDNDTGMYKVTTNIIGFAANGNAQVGVYDGGFYPLVNDDKQLGTTSYRWEKGWFTDIDTTNAVNVSSDRSLKSNIQPATLGLDFVNDLNPVSFSWKDGRDTETTHYGIIAQDVLETLERYGENSIVSLNKDSTSYTARYTEFVPILMKAIQELSAEVKELKEKK